MATTRLIGILGSTLPALVLLVLTAGFVAMSAARRKEAALWLIFAGFVLEIIGTLCTQGILWLARSGSSGSSDGINPVVLVFGIAHLLMFLGGVVGLVGWIVFATKPGRANDRP